MNNSLYDAYQPSGSQSPPSYPSYAVGGMVGAGGNPVPMGQAPGAGLAPQTQQSGQIDPKMMEMQINQFANQRPQEMAQIKQAIEQALQSGELTPQELNMAVQLATVAAQNPQMYPNVRQFAIQQGIATEQDLPQQYDQGLVFVLLLAARAAQQTMGGAPAGAGMTIPSMATGGKVPQSAKPGGGVIIEAHEGEYVIPKNVVDMKGKEFFDNLVAKYAKQAGPSTSEEDD